MCQSWSCPELGFGSWGSWQQAQQPRVCPSLPFLMLPAVFWKEMCLAFRAIDVGRAIQGTSGGHGSHQLYPLKSTTEPLHLGRRSKHWSPGPSS